ncbi:MAG: OmpA family protein [Acidobacteria bacterium]|nr:OmpA family protein [Acidobacteriota bacterium]
MKNIMNRHLISALLITLMLSIAGMGQAQDTAGTEQSQFNAVQVQTGQRLKVEGVILEKQSAGLTLLCPGGIVYNVSITNDTRIKERKKNPLRGAKTYLEEDLIRGLQVEVHGTGDSKGNLIARELKMRHSDLEMARTMDSRVLPVEDDLKETQIRLEESEQNARRLSGQVREVSEVSNSARTEAQKARESADQAMSAANNARVFAEEKAAAANERISALDEYRVKSTVIVLFAAGSADLSEEAKSDLQALAGQLDDEKGYLVEVAGFASSDGSAEYNRRLSQMRSDSVIRHMTETFGIPIRRFITPMGYGENQPIADNQTRPGRRQNRRVEVRILVSKGLTQSDTAATVAGVPGR